MSAQMAYWERQLIEAEEKIEWLRAIIKTLDHQLDEADEAAEEYAVEGDQYRYQLMAAEGAIDTLRAERNDLVGKLATAQAELHELRIAVGLGEFRLDWSQAPEWARWWAADESGEAYWYEKEPELLLHDGMWNNREGQAIRSFPAVSWYVSLRQRPK